jgi:Spy/CpxP family protein refolding chaperone
MIRFRTWALALGVAALLALVGTAGAADKAGKAAKGKGKGLPAAIEQLTQLVPPDPDNKLKLTDDEQKQIAKIQDEFTDKSKDSVAAAKGAFASQKDAIKKARQDKDKAALKEAMAPVRDKVQDVVKVRSDYVAKVRDVLTDEQKTTFDELKQEQVSKGPLANLLGKKGKKKNNQ